MRSFALHLAAAVALATATATATATTATTTTTSSAGAVSFSTNVRGPTQAFTKTWEACVGSGHAELALRADWRAHLAAARTDIGFQRVRFHGLLDDDMSTYLNGGVNLFNVYSVWDYLLSLGMRPIVELSFMPEALASGNGTVFHYKGNISPPASWTAWFAFIRGVVQGAVTRYGLAEVRTWRWEVWNEPNCGFYDIGNCCGPTCGNQTAYFQLYNVTAHAVKSVDAQLQVGGPATAQTGWIPEFVNFVVSNRVPVDFVSSHLYPTDPEVNPTRTGWEETIAAAAKVAASAGLPLVMTEFNSGLGVEQGDDAEYTAAFLGHLAFAAQDLAAMGVDTLSFWTFTDIFEEQGQASAPFNQGFGLQTVYGTPKAGYRALQLLHALAPTAVPVTPAGGQATKSYAFGGATVDSVDVLTTVSGTSGNVTVATLAVNFDYYTQSMTAVDATLAWTGLGASTASRACVTTIDATLANAVVAWNALGQPVYPNATSIAVMNAASQLQTTCVPFSSSGAGTASLLFNLSPLSVNLITFWTTLP